MMTPQRNRAAHALRTWMWRLCHQRFGQVVEFQPPAQPFDALTYRLQFSVLAPTSELNRQSSLSSVSERSEHGSWSCICHQGLHRQRSWRLFHVIPQLSPKLFYLSVETFLDLALGLGQS